MPDAVRLQVAEPAFLAFCTAFAQERAAAGAGPAARIGIGQRADTLAVIAALNDSGGWLAPGLPPASETAETVFARHLAPILCESPAMQAALQRVLARDGVPGVFSSPLPHQTPPVTETPPEPPPSWRAVYRTLLANEVRWRWLRLRAFAGTWPGRAILSVGALAVLAALAAPTLQSQRVIYCAGVDPAAPRTGLALWVCSTLPDPDPDPNPVEPQIRPEPFVAADQGGGNAFVGGAALPADQALGPLHRALSALERTGFDRSPAQLAEHLAATGTLGLDPALYLDAMLTRWPLASDRPIPRSRVGALAVVNFGIAVAELEGDAGAMDAIRSRLPGLFQLASGGVELPDGTFLPDAPQGEEDVTLSLRGLFGIDPRLARHAVDEVSYGVWALARATAMDPSDSFANAPPIQAQSVQQQQQQQQLQQLAQSNVAPALAAGARDLRALYPLADMENFAAQLRSRFGVDPGFDPGGTDPVTLDGIAATIRAGLEAEAPLDGSFRVALDPWPAAVGFVVLAPVLLALVWAVLGYRGALRRRLARWPRLPPPQVHLAVPAPDREAPALALAARRLAPRLRHTPPRETASLDVEATLARTLRQGGYFAPVLRTRRDVASHVVLIHRRTMAEHEPRRIASLLGQLQAAGVSMALYEYAADPARLRPFGQPGGQVRDPERLLQEFPEARLIVVTTGEEFVGAGAYGVSTDSVRALHAWPQRAVVTPVPVAAWGLREWALSVRLGAPLARAGAEGLPDLAAIFPSDPQGPARGPVAAPPRAGTAGAVAWLRRMRETLLPGDPALPLPALLDLSEAEAAVPRGASPERIEAQVVTLRRWLGPEGFLWLQACASYPVLRYPLTRWLGERLFGAAAPLRSLAQLTRLPWFAVGRMPAPLALRLRQALAPADAARIEDLFTEFFARHAVEGPSPAQDAGRSYGGDRIAYEPDALSAGIPGARHLPAGLAVDPGAEASRLRQVRLAVLADRAAVVAASLLLSGALWAVWPDRGALPLPPGAWVPVAGLALVWAVAGALSVVGLAALRRARRALQAPSRAGRVT